MILKLKIILSQMVLHQEINNDWSNWYIELYENFPCSCKEELCKREGEIIRLIGNLNIRIEGRKQKEYQIENKEKIKEKKKEYKKKNTEKIKEYNKEYYLRKKTEKEANMKLN
jgi:hypothetical protein